MNTRAITFVLAGLIIGAAAAIAIFSDAGQQLLQSNGRAVDGKALVGGPFSLNDDTGKRVTDKDYRGRYMLVFFGYTSCPDICPAALQLISAVLENLGPKADRIAPLFISIDPDRDTPQKLADYVKNFDPRLIGLTGTPDEIAKVTGAYKAYYKKVPSESGAADEYSMDHTAIIYVMGPDGGFVTHFTAATNVDEMTAKLDKIL